MSLFNKNMTTEELERTLLRALDDASENERKAIWEEFHKIIGNALAREIDLSKKGYMK